MNESPIHFSHSDILAAMPQQPPFLFVEEADYADGVIAGRYTLKPDEFFFKGHFKNNPVFPGTLMLEAMGQLCVFGLIKGVFADMPKPADPEKIFFTSGDGARCMRICRPNEVLELRAKPTRIRRPIANFEASMSVGGQKASFCEKLTLTFDFIS